MIIKTLTKFIIMCQHWSLNMQWMMHHHIQWYIDLDDYWSSVVNIVLSVVNMVLLSVCGKHGPVCGQGGPVCFRELFELMSVPKSVCLWSRWSCLFQRTVWVDERAQESAEGGRDGRSDPDGAPHPEGQRGEERAAARSVHSRHYVANGEDERR